MISFEEARRIALGRARALPARSVPLVDAAGLVLSEDLRSETDLPPFDRSAMDGYAVRADDLARAGQELALAGEVGAGEAPSLVVGAGECARIFTGAVVPEGADTVVMQEVTEAAGAGRVRFREAAKGGANIARRGEDVRKGERILEAGRRLRAAELALAAAAGVADVAITPRPRVAVLSTGDELVPAGSPVRPGEIRDANGPAIAARLSSAGFEVKSLGIARDDPAETRAKVEQGLACECLVMSGGVSVGDRDFVPAALREMGVEILFEKVAMKPGRPLKFGVKGGVVVWGLPGNPVSVLIATELFVLPVLRKMSGVAGPGPRARRGTLASDYRKKPGRRVFVPARLAEQDGPDGGDQPPEVEPVEYHGSGDVSGYAQADAILTLPADSTGAAAGERVDYYLRED